MRQEEIELIERIKASKGRKERFLLSKSDSKMMLDMVMRTQELEDLFDRNWEAQMRGVNKWREETGEKLTLPDTADFTAWLLDKAFPGNKPAQ